MKKLFGIFTRKSEGSKYMPQLEIKPTSQVHHMLIELLAAYPNGIDTWVFNKPEHGIMNQWNVAMMLRKRGIEIATDKRPHVNRYKREIEVAAYRIDPSSYFKAVELEKSYRKEGDND